MNKKRNRIFQRSSVSGSSPPRDPALVSWFNGGNLPNSSNVFVSENTAMTISAVYAAVNIISESIAMLPWNVLNLSDNRRDIAINDYRHDLLKYRPNRWQNSYEFRVLIIQQLLLRGRSVCELIYNNQGRVTDIMPLEPGSFTPFAVPQTGEIAFEVNDAGGRRILLSSEVLDLRGQPDPQNQLQCLSPIKANSETLGITKAADKYSGSFFGNGTVVSGVLEAPEALSDQAFARLKAWTERHQGVGRSHNPAILEEGLKWKQTSLNAEDSQLIETRKYQVDDIARIFRIPSYKLNSMDRAQYNNVEQQSTDYVVDTLLPRINNIELAVQMALFSKAERSRKSNNIEVKGLLRGDSEARSKFYREMWGIGVYSANDIRALEEENPIEGGSRYFVPVNMAPVDKIDEIFNKIESEPEPEPEEIEENDE